MLPLFCFYGYGNENPRVDGQWLVKRTLGSSWDQVKSDLGQDFYIVRLLGPQDSYALVQQKGPSPLPKVRSIRFSQPNYIYQALDGMDPDFEKSWGLNNTGQVVGDLSTGIIGKDVGALKAWAIHTGAKEMVVAVIDSGVDIDHEDLKNNLWTNAGEVEGNGIDDDGNGWIDDKYGWNFSDGNGQVHDDSYHGTFCAGIIGAEANNQKGSRGVNWHVQMMAVKFLDANGIGSTAGAIDSIRYAVNNGADVINASWGATIYDQALYDAVKWAGQQGVLFVAASGNNGENNDTGERSMYPASFRLPEVISVAAYDNRDQIAHFSNFGKETVHIGAPGMAVFSSEPGGYKFSEGTSFAAPFVTGAVALVKSFVPELDASEVKERLLLSSEVISYYEKERLQSGGRLALYNALRNIRPPRPQPPTAWSTNNITESTDHPYQNNTVKRFEIYHPGATHIRVHFTNFHTEACCDQLVIRDRDEQMVVTYAGKLDDFWSADALGDTMYLDFQSDYSISENGFDIDLYQTSNETTLWSYFSPGINLPENIFLQPSPFWKSFSFQSLMPKQ